MPLFLLVFPLVTAFFGGAFVVEVVVVVVGNGFRGQP